MNKQKCPWKGELSICSPDQPSQQTTCEYGRICHIIDLASSIIDWKVTTLKTFWNLINMIITRLSIIWLYEFILVKKTLKSRWLEIICLHMSHAFINGHKNMDKVINRLNNKNGFHAKMKRQKRGRWWHKSLTERHADSKAGQ